MAGSLQYTISNAPSAPASSPNRKKRVIGISRCLMQVDKLDNVWEKKIYLASLIEDFRELQAIELLKDRPSQGPAVRDYKVAIRALVPLLSVPAQARQTVKLADIEEVLPKSAGAAWRAINEKIADGEIAALNNLDEKTRTLAKFTRVNNIGRKRAEAFYRAGCRSLRDLKNHEKLLHAQAVGLKYFKDFEALIPRSEADQIAAKITSAVKGTDRDFECEVVGSYRRGEPWSSDVDLVIRHRDFTGDNLEYGKTLLGNIVRRISDMDVLSEKALASGPKRYHTLVKLPGHTLARRLDLRLIGWEGYHYMLLGSTGDLDLMKYLRYKAAQQGLFLNEYGMGPRITGEQRGMQKGADMFDEKRKILVNSEEEIFQALNVPYLEPTQRSHKDWSKLLPPLDYDEQ